MGLNRKRLKQQAYKRIARPIRNAVEPNQADQTHSIEFTGIIEPLTETSEQQRDRLLGVDKIDFNSVFASMHPGTPPRCRMFADRISVADFSTVGALPSPSTHGKSGITHYMVQELKKKYPEAAVSYRTLTDHEMPLIDLQGVQLRQSSPGEFDLERMQEALGSDRHHVKPGMTREQIRDLILNVGKQTDEDDDEPGRL